MAFGVKIGGFFHAIHQVILANAAFEDKITELDYLPFFENDGVFFETFDLDGLGYFFGFLRRERHELGDVLDQLVGEWARVGFAGGVVGVGYFGHGGWWLNGFKNKQNFGSLMQPLRLLFVWERTPQGLPLHHAVHNFFIFSHKVPGMTELPFTHIIPGMDSSELVWVEGGTFIQHFNERPLQQVNVPSFAIGKYLVTQELWTAIMGNNPSHFIGAKRPVEKISWHDAQEFFTKIPEHQHMLPEQSFRLPNSAQWEYAARGGCKSGNFRFAGGDKLDEVGWHLENSHNETKEVGLKLPNELGLYDMSGNVWEWCEDHYKNDGEPPNPIYWGDTHIYGGSWDYSSGYCHPSHCHNYYRAHNHFNIGFRVLLCFHPDS